jgi:hypothetical protein
MHGNVAREDSGPCHHLDEQRPAILSSTRTVKTVVHIAHNAWKLRHCQASQTAIIMNQDIVQTLINDLKEAHQFLRN